MKGSLHTDELMGAVVAREGGIRTARRISHCFIMDVPGHAEPLIITDAAVNIAPTLEDKVDIVQNAIDLAHALRLPGGARGDPQRHGDRQRRRCHRRSKPRRCARWPIGGRSPARCSTGRWRSTTPSAREAAAIKHIVSPVAGRANVLVVPDLEAGNMLAKSLSFLAGADAAGIVLGARVPIILTSRADLLLIRLASCAVAALVAAARRTGGQLARFNEEAPAWMTHRCGRCWPGRRRWSSASPMTIRSPMAAPRRSACWGLISPFPG